MRPAVLNQSPVQKGIETFIPCHSGELVPLNQSPVQKGIETEYGRSPYRGLVR